MEKTTRHGAARSLKSKARLRVAIVLDLDWPYKRHIEVYEGILKYAAGNSRWDCTLLPIAEGLPTHSANFGKALLFDGIIARATEELAAQARRENVQLVNVWLNSPATGVVSVLPDCEAIGERAAQHLTARGLYNLGFLGMRRVRESRRFFSGLKKGTVESGAKLSRLLIEPTYNRSPARWGDFQDALEKWIDSWTLPFGVHVCSDLLARYIIEACWRRGLKVPEDVAVIGDGDESPLCLHPEPTLTSIDSGYLQIGFRAAELLNMMMEGETIEVGEYLSRTAQLVARQSTDVFAVEDQLVAAALRFVSENCRRPIGVNDVVEQVPTSRRSLERRFEASIGRSIASEINRMRVRRLQRLLVETDESLPVLAENCGFSDTEHMRRNFYKRTGVTPAQYRKQIRVSAD